MVVCTESHQCIELFFAHNNKILHFFFIFYLTMFFKPLPNLSMNFFSCSLVRYFDDNFIELPVEGKCLLSKHEIFETQLWHLRCVNLFGLYIIQNLF